MTRIVLSARGVPVDFDLLEMKSEMESTPKTEESVKRQVYIDLKRKRGTTRRVKELIEQQARSRDTVHDARAKASEQKNAEPGSAETPEGAPKRRRINRAAGDSE